jgi:hypothetical protein
MNNCAPVFIGGECRSGTTLVVDMLGLHPRLSPIYETDFITKLMDLLFSTPRLPLNTLRRRVDRIMDAWTKPLPHRPDLKPGHERFHHGAHYILFDRPFARAQTARLWEDVTNGQIAAGFRSFIQNLFSEHCRLDGKPRWINKQPHYVNFLPILYDLFPDMRFIHCIRDGRDVACSLMACSWGPKTVLEAAISWRTRALRGVQFGRDHPAQYLEVYYEDLLREPSAQLSRVLSWLGEEDRAAQIVQQYQPGAVSLDESRMGDWRRKFSADDLRAFNEQAGQLLQYFHYE